MLTILNLSYISYIHMQFFFVPKRNFFWYHRRLFMENEISKSKEFGGIIVYLWK